MINPTRFSWEQHGIVFMDISYLSEIIWKKNERQFIVMISGSQVFIDIKKFDNIQIFECRLRFEMGQIQGGGLTGVEIGQTISLSREKITGSSD